ncbi:MAG: glutathione S-transferase family protein [Rhodanobacteraceae bacterium]
MKLYYHPASTSSRPILQFCEDAGIAYEPVVVDLMTGEHLKEPYASVNPNCKVPAIDDDGFMLTESSAILKYLAEKHRSPAYPADLQKRARINEMMDWFNANLYLEYGYHLIYPQIFPHHARQPEAANQATLEWGQRQSTRMLRTLNDYYLGQGQSYLCDDTLSIADYFGAAILTLGELIGIEFTDYPNIVNWLNGIKAMPSWAAVNQAHDGFAAAMKGKSFITLS